ncbi:hypothetical protein, partial [Bacillus xiapuensis]|nr:hypothetical protein [Bacillus xiapuensis]
KKKEKTLKNLKNTKILKAKEKKTMTKEEKQYLEKTLIGKPYEFGDWKGIYSNITDDNLVEVSITNQKTKEKTFWWFPAQVHLTNFENNKECVRLT